MNYSMGFGAGQLSFSLPDVNLLDELVPNEIEIELSGEAEVRRALSSPIGTPLLRDIVKPGETVAIITSDITRPLPSYVLLPSLLDELYAAGIKKEDITLVFALGSHRKHTEAEMIKLVGERAFSEIRCIDGDPTDCVHLGVTSRGTPVDIVREVATANRRIALGNIEYHYFAGYSGGNKAVMPGVSTRAAIQSNHSFMVKPEAAAGRLDGNPLREDIEEAAEFCPLDFLLNVVLDEHKKVIKAVAGHPIKAHREGCAFLDKLYQKPIAKRADIVIVSQGGAPKDLNLYQTQKALDNAKHAIKDGGVIILVGSCKEGLGESVFERWMTGYTPAQMIERIAEHFELGGHKAAAIALVLQKSDIYLVSDLEPDFVRSLHLTPFAGIQEALDAAMIKMGKDASVILMPYGGSTLPSSQS